MARKKTENPVEEVVAAAPAAALEAEVVVSPEAEAAKREAVIKHRDHKGEETSPTFSKDVHGKDSPSFF